MVKPHNTTLSYSMVGTLLLLLPLLLILIFLPLSESWTCRHPGTTTGTHYSFTTDVDVDVEDNHKIVDCTEEHDVVIMSPLQDRRRLMGTVLMVGLTTIIINPNPVSAKYGSSSNMELPSYIDYLVEKNKDPNNNNVNALYKGADPAVLLRRLQDADNRLQEIPKLATERKWSQVQGLLTGPLGTLSQTLNQIVTPNSDRAIQSASKTLKADLINIGQGASKKNEDICIKAAQQASKDLISFLEIAFD